MKFFRDSVIDDNAFQSNYKPRRSLDRVFGYSGSDHFTKTRKKGRQANRIGGGSVPDDFSHPLANEGGFWGVNKENGQQLLRRYNPAEEPIDLTGNI